MAINWEQIVEPLFGTDLVERVGTNTRLGRVGVGEEPQVPGNTATEWEPVAATAVVFGLSWTGDPVVLSPSSCMKLSGGFSLAFTTPSQPVQVGSVGEVVQGGLGGTPVVTPLWAKKK